MKAAAVLLIATAVRSSHLGVFAVATALGATATSIIGYLQAERVLRPVAIAALRQGVPEQIHAPGVILRTLLTWVLSTGVPILAIIAAIAASKLGILHAPAEELSKMVKNIPAGYIGSTDDAAATVCFLVSDEARYINGTNIHLSGAWGV